MNKLTGILFLTILLSMNTALYSQESETKCIVEVSDKKAPPTPALIKIFEAKGYVIKVKENDTAANFNQSLKKWTNVKGLNEEELASIEDKYLLVSMTDFKPMCRVETVSISFGSLGGSKSKYNCTYLQVMFNTVQDKNLVRVLPVGKTYGNAQNVTFKSEEEALADVYKKLDADLAPCSKIRSANNIKKALDAIAASKVNPNEINEKKQPTEVMDSPKPKEVEKKTAEEKTETADAAVK